MFVEYQRVCKNEYSAIRGAKKIGLAGQDVHIALRMRMEV